MDGSLGINVEKKSDLRFVSGLPECPTCKTIKDMIFFNVTEKIYECLHCKAQFRVVE